MQGRTKMPSASSISTGEIKICDHSIVPIQNNQFVTLTVLSP